MILLDGNTVAVNLSRQVDIETQQMQKWASHENEVKFQKMIKTDRNQFTIHTFVACVH